MKALLLLVTALSLHAADYQLKASPSTVVWGYYWSAAKPVLKINSGDTVEIQTMTTGSPTSMVNAGLNDSEVQPELKAIFAEVKDKGPGGHILTGPIYVEGAEPGDTLEVRIQKIQLAVPYATNGFRPGRGFLPDDFPYARFKLIPLDRERMVARFAPGIEIPLRPFFGSMGVAPPETNGRISSGPPWVYAGNLDNKELVAGHLLFFFVHARGAGAGSGGGAERE